ncbi:MAG: DUF4830 domain-containing protein [Clostridia bacterium]|nr:DUF4830 domain-containing protein [Clostridia bacterium]
MFVYTVRSSSVKFFAVLLLCLVLVITLMLSGGVVSASAEPTGQVRFTGIKTKEDRIAFIASAGATVDAESEEVAELVMPESFDTVLRGYNEIQKSQGLDITKYARKRVTRYTYRLAEYEGEQNSEVYVNIFVYRNRIIACDVSSRDEGGFVRALVR